MKTKNKSNNGTLVKNIVRPLISDMIFESVDSLHDTIQNELNDKLPFETRVTNIRNENGFAVGDIYFNDEENTVRVMNFTIDSKS